MGGTDAMVIRQLWYVLPHVSIVAQMIQHTGISGDSCPGGDLSFHRFRGNGKPGILRSEAAIWSPGPHLACCHPLVHKIKKSKNNKKKKAFKDKVF